MNENRINHRIFIVAILLMMLLPFTGCGEQTPEEVEFISENHFALDTVNNIKVYQPEEGDQEIILEAFDLIDEIEEEVSVHIEGSDLQRLKEQAGKEAVVMGEHAMSVLSISQTYAGQTEGLFDITAGPLIDLWNIRPPEGYVPTQEELEEAMALTDYEMLQLNEEEQSAYLEKEGMIANLGAVAKGYIADQVKDYLMENGIEHAIINLGGNIALINGKTEELGFRIGIQDPDQDRGGYLGVLETKDRCIVSSGDYERYFEQDGKRYHHILNPFTGYPAESDVRQVTIVSEKSINGDALSTIAFLVGSKEGMELVRELNEVEAIFVTENKTIYVSEGLSEEFTLDEENYGEIYEVEYY